MENVTHTRQGKVGLLSMYTFVIFGVVPEAYLGGKPLFFCHLQPACVGW